MKKILVLFLFVLNLSCMRDTWDDHTFLYVVNYSDNTFSRLEVDLDGNVMLWETTALPAAGTPNSMFLKIHPNNKFVYVQLTSFYAVYMAEDDGTLINPQLFANITRGSNSFGIYIEGTHFFSPNGKWHTIVNGSDTTVFLDSVDQTTGMLTQVSATGTGNWPGSPIFHPSGKYFYVFTVSGNGYYAYCLSEDGLVTSGPAWVGWSEPPPERVAIHPSGQYIYGTNNSYTHLWMIPVISGGADIDYNNVVQYTIVPGSNYGTYIHPNGKFLYTISGVNIEVWRIDQTTGQLMNVSSYTLTATPCMVAFNPSGQWPYVSHPTANKVTVLNVDGTTGALTFNSEFTTGSLPNYIGVARDSRESR